MKNKLILLVVLGFMPLTSLPQHHSADAIKYNEVVKSLEDLRNSVDAAMNGEYNNPAMLNRIEHLTHAKHALESLPVFHKACELVNSELSKTLKINKQKLISLS